jgi:hypothetical protein
MDQVSINADSASSLEIGLCFGSSICLILLHEFFGIIPVGDISIKIYVFLITESTFYFPRWLG